MSIETALQGLEGGEESTAVDVAMKLLDKESAVMHTEIKNPSIMNALLIARMFCTVKNRPKCAEFFKTLYEAQVLHMVSYKRQRPKEIVKVLTSQLMALGLDTEKKKGLLGFGGK